jgi:hypothetical protein
MKTTTTTTHPRRRTPAISRDLEPCYAQKFLPLNPPPLNTSPLHDLDIIASQQDFRHVRISIQPNQTPHEILRKFLSDLYCPTRHDNSMSRKARKIVGKTSKAPPILERVKRLGPGLTARGMRFLFHVIPLRPRLYTAYTAPRPPPRPRHKHVQTPSPTLQAIFLFLVLPSPKKGGRGGVGARSSSSKNP